MEHDDQKQDFNMSIILKNITFIDWETFEFKQGNIKIDDTGYEFIKSCSDDAYDGTGKLVTKSFVCAHHHAYSALARGMPAPKVQPQNFSEVLKYIWWNLDKNLDADMIKASALVTALECIKKGVTFVIDHHASPFSIKGSLDIIADAFDQVGINHLLCYEMSDRDGDSSIKNGLKETEEYLKNRQGLVGLHASFTVGDHLLKSAVSMAENFNSGIHIHVAEDMVDQDSCMKDHRCRVIERLYQSGALDFPKTILAHCIHLNENERKILANSKAWIAVNTESNLNNQVGLFSSAGDLETKVLLGTDGMHSDMLRSAQANYFTHKAIDPLSIPDFYERLRRAHRYLKENDFKGDGDNNLVIFDYKSPTPVANDNWLGHFFYGLTSGDINGLICNGQWVLKDRQTVKVEENEVLDFAKDQAKRLWEKLV